MTWVSIYNNRRYPSFNQIVGGLLLEVMKQIELAMGNMEQHLVLEAKANLKETWEGIFNMADVKDRDKKLDDLEELEDPNHPWITFIIYICQIQSFVLPEINLAYHTRDITKVETLGPFEVVLSKIVEDNQFKRKDIEKYNCM